MKVSLRTEDAVSQGKAVADRMSTKWESKSKSERNKTRDKGLQNIITGTDVETEEHNSGNQITAG